MRTIPNELLDLIFDCLGDKSESPRRKPTKDWLACSLVCWKWRSIALPHLFYGVECTGNRPAGRSVDAYSRFFAETPRIGIHVRLLVLSDIARLDIASLSTIIGNLPRLSHLRLYEVVLVDGPDNSICQSQNAYVLESMQCESSFFQVLALFSRIEYLHLMDHSVDDTPDVLSLPRLMDKAVESCNVGKLQIDELRIGPSAKITYFYPTFLTQIQAIQHLTSLTFETRYELPALKQFNECLCSTGQTLKSLHIMAEEDWPKYSNLSVRSPDVFTNATRRGFAACVNLEEFTLVTEVSGVGYTKEASWHEGMAEDCAYSQPLTFPYHSSSSPGASSR
ncbi:hypothetical protein BC629DRAFT_1056420 [Irpex lacteus]|nr:hypothetical protein BC629DRAFT_1056420 [Irpex lacteus]